MKRRSPHSFNALLILYLMMILLLSGVLTGTSYFLLFFFGFGFAIPCAEMMAILIN